MTRRARLEHGRAVRAYLFMRGMLYLGKRFHCPCCEWSLRSFVSGGGSLRRRPAGYCPRCNAKARHRRVWLHLVRDAQLLGRRGRILHVAPHESLTRAFERMSTMEDWAIDVTPRSGIDVVATATALPFAAGSFEGVVSIHVLEHLDDDAAAILEMARVVGQGGWAVVNVPCDWESVTYEDAAITTPDDRRAAFGEADHRRRYGRDLVDRLARAGFEVTVFLATDLDPRDMDRHGLTSTEHVFACRPVSAGRP